MRVAPPRNLIIPQELGMRTRRWQHFMSSSLAAAYAGALAICTMAPRNAHAVQLVQQSTEITGVVTDGRNRQPVSGASVLVAGTRLGVQSGVDGRFRIGGVSTGGQVVMVRRLGYATQRRSVTLTGPQVMNFELEPAAMSLDEVVVTGTAGGEIRRSIGNAVATINADDALAKSGAQSVSTLIGARAPGVIIAPSTGRLGAGPAIQIRGRSSIGLDNSPILFVDGVRVNNATNAGPVAPAGRLGGQASNVSGRLNDISPDDIESIEIIKGPAASTIYGTEAASGVIQIITKRGAAGNRPQTSLSSHLGADIGASALLGAVVGHKLLFPNARGFYPNYTPDVPQTLYDNAQGVRRFIGSATLTHRPTDWLSHRLLVGVDETGDDSRAIEKFTADPAIVGLIGAVAAGGSIGQALRDNTIVTTQYSAKAKATLRSGVTATSSVGGQFYRTELNASFLGGTGFPGYGVETVNSASTPAPSTQAQTLNTTIGAYGQEQFGWRDRLYLTGALRVDNNSAFGDKLKWVTYPKVSLAWVASEEPFWRTNSVVTSLRLRGAYGQSGRQPAAFSALRTFSPAQGPGGTSAVTPNSKGNPDLRPERGTETELGFETQLFNRLDVDFTYFNRRTTDLIINQPVAPSSGFYVATPANLGRVDNHGVEMLATLHALTRRNLSWDVIVNVATSQDQIKDLAGIGGIVVSAGQTNVCGSPIGGIFTKRVVSADRDATTGFATNVLCDGGEGKPAVACATAPFVFIGTPTPKVTGSVANTVTLFGNLRLYGLVDYKRGHRVSNNNEQLRCTGAVGAPLCRANYYPLEYDPVYLAERVGTAVGQGIVRQEFQDRSFAKLCESSLPCTLPPAILPAYHGSP